MAIVAVAFRAVVPQGAVFPVEALPEEAFPEVVSVAAALVADSRRRVAVRYCRRLRRSPSPRVRSAKQSQIARRSSNA